MPLLAGTLLADASPSPDPARWVARARRAEEAGLDFLVVEPGPADAVLVAALVAARTERIGLIVRIATATSEPFHVSTQLATIDVVSHGRAGWLVDPTPDPERTTTWPAPADPVADAREHVEVVRALWDSWEDGAEVRDAATSRFLDRDRVHHVDFRGEHLAVRGPSITPRPPQGQPVVVAGGPLAGRADVVLARSAPDSSGAPWMQLLDAEDDATRGVDPAADAVLVVGSDLDAATAAAASIAAGSRGTLRERFGLPAAVNRFAAARGTA